MIVKHDSAIATTVSPDVAKRVLARGGQLMAVEFNFKEGGVGDVHTHPHAQIGYVVQGEFELDLDGKKEVLASGDSYYAAPNVPHGVVALEDGVMFDVFSPQREDFL